MSTYVFKAIDLAGTSAKGEVEAASKQAVADQLKSRGLIVVDISDKHASKEISLAFFERIKSADLTIATRQLATMVASGMTLLRALYVLEEQTDILAHLIRICTWLMVSRIPNALAVNPSLTISALKLLRLQSKLQVPRNIGLDNHNHLVSKND